MSNKTTMIFISYRRISLNQAHFSAVCSVARNVSEAGILAFCHQGAGLHVCSFRVDDPNYHLLPDRPSCGSGRIDRHFWREFVGISDYLLKYLRNRRIVGGDGQRSNEQAPPMKRPGRHLKQRAPERVSPSEAQAFR